jgi:hypothetical protein
VRGYSRYRRLAIESFSWARDAYRINRWVGFFFALGAALNALRLAWSLKPVGDDVFLVSYPHLSKTR